MLSDLTEKLQLLNKEAESLCLQGPERALELAKEAERLAREHGDSKALAESLLIIASAKWQMGLVNEVEHYAAQALEIFGQLKDKLKQIRALQALGLVYRRKGQTGKALQVLQEVLTLAGKMNDKQLLANVKSNLGVLYGILADYATAVDFLAESIQTYRELGDTLGEAGALANFALVCAHNNDKERAIELYQEAVHHFQVLNAKLDTARALMNMGGIYLEQKKLNLALSHAQQALEISIQLNNMGLIAHAKQIIANVLLEKGQTQEAQRLLVEGLCLAEKAKDRLLECNLNLNLGRVCAKQASCN